MSSEPIRQPANDLIAFDIRRQSPEQIAKLFARWKEQRKRLQASGPRRGAPHLTSVPPIVHGAAEETVEAAPTTVADTEPSGAVRYSASFEALLVGREPTLAQRVWNPDAGLAKLGRAHPPRRRSKTKWLLAGAASVIAVAAVAGSALWEQSTGRTGWKQAADKPDNALVAKLVEAAATYPMDIPMAEPFAAKATASPQADWPMRQAVDLALMRTAPVVETAPLPLMPQLKPPVPVVQTASKAPPEPQPEAAPPEAPVARVELPLVSRVTTATVSIPVTPATEVRKDDAHPNIVARRGKDKDKDNVSFGSNERVASSGSRSTGAAGSGAGGSTGGSDEPGSGGTGGHAGGDTGGGDTGGGAGGGSSGGDGSGESGEGGESGESGEGGSADSGGIGGAVGGALGGLGNALGGGKGNPDGDKDKDKQKSKEKDD